MVFKIALRNVLRNKRRALITSVTIAVGLAMFIYMQSMLAGTVEDGINSTLAITDTAARIHTKEYSKSQDAYPLKHGIKNYDEIRSEALSINGVVGVTKRSKILATITSYENNETLNMQAVVIDADTDESVFAIKQFLNEENGSKYLENGTGYEVLISDGLASDLGVEVGDYVMLSGRTEGGMIAADDFVVVGTYSTPIEDVNRMTLYISYTSAEDVFDLAGFVSEVNVKLDRPKGMRFEQFKKMSVALDEKLQAEFPQLDVISLEESLAEFVALMKQKESTSYVLYITILLIAAVGIINNVLMSVYERIREVGVLRALGFTSGEVVAMFTIEGAIVGIFGSLVGIALGALINIPLVYYGIDFSQFYGKDMSVGLPIGSVIYGEWNIAVFIFALIFGVVISIFSSVFPARTAGSIKVTKALRFE